MRQYDLWPDRPAVVEKLLPLVVRLRLFRCFLTAAAGEQLARMTAMHSANTAADKMIRQLSMRMNRARQGQITRELAEIIGGAEAQV
jgi:F-type H+-transporting ATPase subunit gamma